MSINSTLKVYKLFDEHIKICATIFALYYTTPLFLTANITYWDNNTKKLIKRLS